MSPIIIIPRVRKPGDTTGLELRNSHGHVSYYARYTEGEVRRCHSLKTTDKAKARAARDAFYADLVAKGATVAGRAGRKAKVKS